MWSTLLFGLLLTAPSWSAVVPSPVEELQSDIAPTAQISDVTYYFYTRSNEFSPLIIYNNNVGQLQRSALFDPSKIIIIIIHGWVDDYQGNVNDMVKTSAFIKSEYNIIVVDWSPIASENYLRAKNSVEAIGQIIGSFIGTLLSTYGLSGSNVIIVGHSLGAHIAGCAGAAVQPQYTVGHIIGLDPAGPLFDLSQTHNRLDATDGGYVSIIHSNNNLLGIRASIGHVDFYPNGGGVQAGCGIDLIGSCSHMRAIEYLAEGINSPVLFRATRCGSWNDYRGNRCRSNPTAVMGLLEATTSVTGNYYLATNTRSPFARG